MTDTPRRAVPLPAQAMDEIDVKRMLREAVRAAGSQKAWAERHGIAQSYVSDVLRGERELGKQFLVALGVRRVTRYVPVRQGDAAPAREGRADA
jgi:hypothetical protein